MKVYSHEGPLPVGLDRVGNQRPGKKSERNTWGRKGRFQTDLYLFSGSAIYKLCKLWLELLRPPISLEGFKGD